MKHITNWRHILIILTVTCLFTYIVLRYMHGNETSSVVTETTGTFTEMITEKEISVMDPKEFLVNYLESYKNVREKQNFNEIRSFFTSNTLYNMNKGMSIETNYTHFDDYKILSIDKYNERYSAKVKLFSEGETLVRPDKDSKETDIMFVYIVKEGNSYKTDSWYFTE